MLDRMLTLDPERRINADDALNDDFFWVNPMPSSLEGMMLQHKQSMFQYLVQAKNNQEAPRQHANQLQDSADSGYQDIVFWEGDCDEVRNCVYMYVNF